jgi:hypothetical protein
VGLLAPVFVLATASVVLAIETVECGLIREYTAPDPGGPTPGAIAFGLSGPVETIAADATLVPPIDTNLSGLVGGTPTCVTVNRDGGVIDSLAFAASGSITGTVTLVEDLFGPGDDGYLLGDRLFVPVMVATDNLGLSALFPTAADAGVDLTVSFDVDVSTGFPVSFGALTSLSGPVTVEADGDVRIGDATLPAGVIDSDSLAALEEAASMAVDATVLVTGVATMDPDSVGGVNMAITLTVSFSAPATPAPTATSVPTEAPALLPDTALTASMPARDTGSTALACMLAVAIATLSVASRPPKSSSDARRSL